MENRANLQFYGNLQSLKLNLTNLTIYILRKSEPLPITKPKDILNYLICNCIYHEVTKVLLLYITLFKTTASVERLFSKLKLIKTYLQTRMSQKRLLNLAILSIEHEEAQKIVKEGEKRLTFTQPLQRRMI